jgi:Mg2+-importing ATPase
MERGVILRNHTVQEAAQIATPPLGLTSEEARRRLAASGPNEPAAARRVSLAQEMLPSLANPLVLILLLASVIAFFAGEHWNALIIVAMVVLSVALNSVQTFRSRKAADALRARVAPTARVLRDGAETTVPRREVVPGDVVVLAAGDLVPADATLLEEEDLHVQEAALTGESLPVEKEVHPEDPKNAEGRVFLGTSVVSGSARALVTATGPATQFGDIAARLSAKPPETEFDRGTRVFGLFILRTVVFLVFFVLLVNLALHRPALDSLLFAVALAVGLTPEFLPMITAVTLARGAVRMARKKVIVKHLAAIQNFGSVDVLCSDKTGTLTTGLLTLGGRLGPSGDACERPFELAFLNSSFETGIRSPLDEAIRQAPPPADSSGWNKVDEVPFDFERRRLSIVAERGGQRILVTKGAPESVLQCSSAYETGEGGRTAPLDAAARERAQATYLAASARGERVVAVAYRLSPPVPCEIADERDLVLAGFLTFADPPREDAAHMLKVLRRDGVRVQILTGDGEPAARHVCARVGLPQVKILLGDEVDRMSDTALAHAAEETDVFARVSPAQKTRILLSLKRRGHVVGFLGDGINDAPSLHTADVGISVASGVEVAREAAEIILLEPGLNVLHAGILEGRRAFGNVMKYLLMGTSSNFGNMFSMAGASLFLPFLPMLPTQILLNNFLYDLAQVTIPTDNVDASFLRRPRHWDIRLIRDFMIYIGPVSSIYDFLTFWALLSLFHAGETLFHTGWFIESLATQTLVLFVIRTAGNPLKSRPSLPLALTTVGVVAVGVALPYSPLAGRLGFTPLPGGYFLFLAGVTVTYLVLVEVVKRRLFSRRGL